MTSTEEKPSETTITIDTTAPATPAPASNPIPTLVNGPNIKRNVQLYRYGVANTTKLQGLNRLLGKKRWKEVQAIIYDDSTLKVFDDTKFTDPLFVIKLDTVALYLGFGQSALKYGPPPINGDETNFIAPNNFLAIPETKERDKVHWYAVKDERHLKDLIQAVAETVDKKVNPPPLGKGFRYASDDSKWITYWTTSAQPIHAAENIDGENNGESKFVATPLVAVMEQKKLDQQKAANAEKIASPPPPVPAKNGSVMSKLIKPTPHPRQQINYYNIDFEMPEIVETLRLESADGLMDDQTVEEEKSIVVRLVNGKRVKETIVNPKKSVDTPLESSPSPPNYPPPPIPKLIIEEEKLENINDYHRLESNIGLQEEIEILALMKNEPMLISMTNFNLDEIPPPTDDKKEENIEIVATNLASVEHTFSTNTEYVSSTNGITCTTTKENSTFQQNTNGTAAVH